MINVTMPVDSAMEYIAKNMSETTNQDVSVHIQLPTYPDAKQINIFNIMSRERWNEFIQTIPPKHKIELIKLIRSACVIELAEAKHFVEDNGCK